MHEFKLKTFKATAAAVLHRYAVPRHLTNSYILHLLNAVTNSDVNRI